jgi:hypothetical protein
VQRVTVWDRDDMISRLEAGEQIAGFSWDPVKKEGGIQFGFSRNFEDGRFKELHERKKQLHREYRMSITAGKYRASVSPLVAEEKKPVASPQAPSNVPGPAQSELFPVVIPAECVAHSASELADSLWTRGKMPIEQLLGYLAETPRRIPSLDPVQAFGILHETTELGIVDLYMRGSDRRWFCDGVANYVAWRVIRDQNGAEVASRAYDLPAQLAHYAPLREQADLRLWPAVENESVGEQASELETARYAFATNAIVLMNQRAGEDVLPRLFVRMGRTDAREVSIQTVATAWKELTGEPLSGIVTAAVYGADAPPVPDDSGLQRITTAASGGGEVASGFRLSCKVDKETNLITKVVIDTIDRGSPAERAGLKAGDRVLEISGQRLAGLTLPELRKLASVQLTSGQVGTQELRVQRGVLRKELKLVVELKEPEPVVPDGGRR